MEIFAGLNQFSDFGLLALRIVIGIIFLVHSFPKLTGAKAMAQGMGKPEMAGFFTFLGISETLGAIALLSGFLTQAASAGLGIIMIGAIGMKIGMMKAPFSSMEEKPSWEFDLMILSGTIVLFFSGAGYLGLDRIIFGL